MQPLDPLLILALSVAFVLVAIIWLRLNAFLALIVAAMLVSLLAPGPIGERIARVAAAFGETAGKIGIVIAMAAVIGQFMMASGAADRIVLAFHRLLGPNRDAEALTASGFVLSIPVFFDTVFYLLVPLARSMYRRQGRNYLKFLLGIGAGGAATHCLVPPTPGPLATASILQIDLGVAISMATFIGLPMAVVGLLFAGWADSRWPLEMRPRAGEIENPPLLPERDLPNLTASLAPVILPVLLITGHTVLAPLAERAAKDSLLYQLGQWSAVLGDANFALLLSAAIAVFVYLFAKKAAPRETTNMIEQALMSGGIIILITAAGGAFGAMLREAGIGDAIRGLFDSSEKSTGITLLLISFATSSLLKSSQGSSTVAMITTASIIAAMLTPETQLGYHRVYLATAIGSGSLVVSWMNDSGFWIFSRMGGLTEAETLRSWTPLTAILGVTGMAMTLLLALVLPMESPTTLGHVERLDPAIDKLIPPNSKIELLASGFDWSEGPVWIKDGGYLLFSDVPRNVVHRWKEGEGVTDWLTPSGYTGTSPREMEMGSNGLALDAEGRLVLCQHGDRRVARLDAPLDHPQPNFVTLADKFDGKQFNSPNDLVFHSSGAIYFTDPPYGLVKQWDDPARELGHCGVYRLDPNGKVELLTDKMTRPNGIGLSPDERTLYVANSDDKAPIWKAFTLDAEGSVIGEQVFFDANQIPHSKELAGLPDGLKVDKRGNVFATGPGGVFVLSPEGKHLGTISTGHKIANCAFGDDGQTLYMTSDDHLCRLRLSTTGLGF